MIAGGPYVGQPRRTAQAFSVRRSCVVAAAFCALAAGIAGAQPAAAWKPARNVELIFTGGPGSGPALLARTLESVWRANRMLSVPVALVNKPGGNYAIAWNHLNQHPGDGHYLLMASLSLLTSSATGVSAIRYTEATLIAQLFTEYIAFAVRADAPFITGAEVAARLRQDPGSLTFATGGDGVGGANHLAAAQAMRAAGVDIRKLKVVQFRSSAEAATAVLGGHVDIVAAPPAALLADAGAAGLRLIAISAPERSWGELAAVPTWRELGIDAVFSTARAIVGPAGLDPGQVRYWEELLRRTTRTAQWRKSLADNNRSPAYLGHDACRNAWHAQYGEIKALLDELGLAPERN